MGLTIEDINPIGQQRKPPTSTTYGGTIYGDLRDRKEDYIRICAPLYTASIDGDWEAARVIFEKHKDLDLVGYALSGSNDTALHVAAGAKSSKWVDKFVQNLVTKMTREQLELRNANGNTALCLAVAGGNVKTVKTLLEKHPALVDIPGSRGMMPLYMASLFGQSEIVNHLYEKSGHMSGDGWTDKDRSGVLQKCVQADLFDVALKIVSRWPRVAKISGPVLAILARKTDAFKATKPHFIRRILRPILAVIHVKVGVSENPSDAMKLLRIVWAEIMKLDNREISSIIKGPPDQPTTSRKEDVQHQRPNYSSDVLFVAAEMGNTEVIVEIFCQFPELIYYPNDNHHTIFHVAVLHRREGIYNLLHDIPMKDLITPMKDNEGNNMLHLVGKCVNNNHLQNDLGVGLQMQHELLWFKEVEALVPPSYRKMKNHDGLTPHELFMEEHKDLVSANEKWMKDTANQCLVVGALIASIAFAAAFGVPGGYNQNTGIPIFLHNPSFIAFVISDAISLAFSSISILIFLSIYLSRYAELDFMQSLPKKLMTGLATLFFSIAAMLVGFSVSFFVIFQANFIWVPIVVALFISIPVVLYAKLQYNLFGDVYYSIFGYKHIFRPKNRRLFYRTPSF